MRQFYIDFEPVGRRGRCAKDKSILDVARELGIGINSICDGHGTCHSCRIRVMQGAATPPTKRELLFFSSEELDKGWRLACQTYPLEDGTVYLPPESMTTLQRIQVEGIEITVKPEPAVKFYQVKLDPPALSTPVADGDRLLEALNHEHKLGCSTIDLSALQVISPLLRGCHWECRVAVRGNEVIRLCPTDARALGLAVDMGTTNIAGYLVDLETGENMARKAVINPQVSYGGDIVTRMARAAGSPEEARNLQTLLVDAVNGLAGDLCRSAGVRCNSIVDAVMAGNTAIHHLLLGLPVRQLATAPYVAAIREAMDIRARDLNFNFAPGAYVHLPANIAGFVGADHTADLLAVDALSIEDTAILIDIGTNTEISLIRSGEITSVSCASGPAFEGGHIRDGMRATDGAIERLRINNGMVTYRTIADAPPSGICGSGVLDALAEMYHNGIVDKGGRMADNGYTVLSGNGQREFRIVDSEKNISITQGDVRELQLAKAAIRSGIQILLETGGLADDDIDRVIIAGAFGTYIDVASAVTIGMLPPIPEKRFTQIGNAAGTGARLALVSTGKRAEAKIIARSAHYIELATAPNFMPTFTQSCFLGRYHLRKGKREDVS
ncbi:MAG: ASKHA domain-containing protein [Chloroflexota bacterium]